MMLDESNSKIKQTHLRRMVFVYVRQSSPTQVKRNPESRDLQYKLVHQAIGLGWPQSQIAVVDEDLGVTASGVADRLGFDKMTAQVALGHVGMIIGIEVSRLARTNADWYRLLDICGMTNTLIADGDGIYHPAQFNDRLLLGLKGTMSEAELHILRARLEGGIRNKAQRGELRRGLPVGFVWGEHDGEVLFHLDESVTQTIRTIFERFAELGSVRQVWLWFRQQNLPFPLRRHMRADLQWVPPSYASVHQVLTNPVYAGAYAYGKSRHERYMDDAGKIRKRVRRLPQSQWAVLIPGHHPGFIDWDTYQANQARIAQNTRPKHHQPGGAVREGSALLQGLATCGRCGRRLRVYYQGKNSTPGYYCSGQELVNGRSVWCLRVGGTRVDQAVADTVLTTIEPLGIEASFKAEEVLQAEHDTALAQWKLQVERAQYEAERAERRYRAIDPENRLVARNLEADWERCLQELSEAEAELAHRQQQIPTPLDQETKARIHALGVDLQQVWAAPTTTDRDRKELLRTLLEEVNICVDRQKHRADLTLRWRGGTITTLCVDLWRTRRSAIRTDEDTIALVRRLACHYPDAIIAGILNRQGRRTARGHRFTANRVGNLRRHWNIARFEPSGEPPQGDLVTVEGAAQMFGVAPSTVHRWLNDGFIVGEQMTPGAPWRIRMTDELRARFVEEEREGYVPMIEATKILGVSRQTVLQRVKRGELKAVHLCRGKRKGLRIKVDDAQADLFTDR